MEKVVEMRRSLGVARVALVALAAVAWPAAAAAADPARTGQRAAGDFNGDGFADLAVGAPGEDVGAAGDAGAVNVLYGSAGGPPPPPPGFVPGRGGLCRAPPGHT